MKVLLFNGSPNVHGCTYTALKMVATTLETEGIETEIIHLGTAPIGGCLACGFCRMGDHHCVQNDLVNEILPKLREINPRLDDAVARLSVLANDDEDYFNKKIHEALLSFGENRQKNELPLNFLKSNEKEISMV